MEPKPKQGHLLAHAQDLTLTLTLTLTLSLTCSRTRRT